MILTVTLNTSIDKLYLMTGIRPETVMRVKEVHNTAGGKGLNVSRVAGKLGEQVTAAGFVGGFNGLYLESLIDTPLVRCAFTHVKAETRSCINCWDLSDGKSTEYLEPGAPVTGDEVAVPVLVDTSGSRLVSAAGEKPTLIKPNEDEIVQLTGHSFSGPEEAARILMDLHENGIPYVVLSMGAEGALLACEAGVFHGKPPEIVPRNTVGCGDSMTAGFAVGFARSLSTEETFRLALAVSAASALSLFTGDFDAEDYKRLLPEISIRRVL